MRLILTLILTASFYTSVAFAQSGGAWIDAIPEPQRAIEKISGLVTDSGGRLCHAAIIAREYRIPCVVGIGSATREIAPRTLICVDGDRGQVSKVR